MKKYILLILSVLAMCTPLKAQDYAASLKVSTLGINLEAIRSFGPQLNARVGFAFFNYTYEGGGGSDDYIYTAKAKLLSITALADYFPFGELFRITGGLFVNLNKGDIKLVPTESYTIGGDVYTPDKLGNLNADVDFNKVAPYIGIGFGNSLSGDSGLRFTLDLGTVYQGPANIKLSAHGLLEPSAATDQEEVLENNLSWFKWYPVLSLGIVYKF